MLTRNKICYNLPDSPFRLTVGANVYHFSSFNHLDKFSYELEDFTLTLRRSLENRFNVAFNVTTLAEIILYRKIETRGFYIMVNGVACKCPENLLVNSQVIASLNSDGKLKDIMQN